MVKWSQLSHERLEEAENSLIQLSGVPMDPMRIYLDDPESYSIFCLKCGSPSNPPLILLHGYLGTSIIFYKILKELSQHYMVYCLDLMGMGRSSRPHFAAETREEAELFFIEPLEQCREKLGLEKIVLAGHSFGGYVAGCYTESYSSRVSKLVLISSIGVPTPPNGLTPKKWSKTIDWKFRLFMRFAKYMMKKDITPASILRMLGPFSEGLVRKYMVRRWNNVPVEELNHLEAYVEQVNLYPGSGEFAFKDLFAEGGFALKPLHDRITNTPVVFIYGDRDWMDPEGAVMNSKHNRCEVIREIISESGHHMYIENPSELVQKMVAALGRLREIS